MAGDFLSKEEIFAMDDLKMETISILEWQGKKINIIELPATERDEFENWMLSNKGDKKYENFRARLCSLCIVNEEKKRIFTKDDIEQLGRKSASVLDKICNIAQRLSGMLQEDVDKATKNL